MKASIILSTYNSPEWLKKVIWGYSFQTQRNFELIIADDGSTAQTAELIDEMRDSTGLEIKHIWQSDKGFRKCRILNKAILHVKESYVIFSDGDCIPRADFVKTHLSKAEPNRFVSGSYFKLPMETSKAIEIDQIKSGECFKPSWLLKHGLRPSRKLLKISTGPHLARFLNCITPVNCNFKGSNAAAWLTDILHVNGFDERMPWGGEDREFGVRLVNSGIRPKHAWYDAVCLHLDHARGYVDPVQVKKNKALRIYNHKNKVVRTEFGIEQLIQAGYSSDS